MRTDPKTITLNDVFPGWMSNGGFFYILTRNFNVPWADTIGGDILDLDYHGNRSGTKVITPLLVNMIEDSEISSAKKLKLAELAYRKYGLNWSKLWDTLTVEYNPIQNYSMTETISGTETETQTPDNWTETVTGTAADNESKTSSEVYGFNSADASPERDITTNTKINTSTERSGTFETEKENISERTRAGNIGVTTSQQMITSERELWFWQIFDTVFTDVDSLLVTQVYGHTTYDIDYSSGGSSYVLPVANSSDLGGVKANAKTSENGQIVIDDEGFLYFEEPTLTDLGGVPLSSLSGLTFAYDEEVGKWGYKIGGAGSVIPFSSDPGYEVFNNYNAPDMAVTSALLMYEGLEAGAVYSDISGTRFTCSGRWFEKSDSSRVVCINSSREGSSYGGYIIITKDSTAPPGTYSSYGNLVQVESYEEDGESYYNYTMSGAWSGAPVVTVTSLAEDDNGQDVYGTVTLTRVASLATFSYLVENAPNLWAWIKDKLNN